MLHGLWLKAHQVRPGPAAPVAPQPAPSALPPSPPWASPELDRDAAAPSGRSTRVQWNAGPRGGSGDGDCSRAYSDASCSVARASVGSIDPTATTRGAPAALQSRIPVRPARPASVYQSSRRSDGTETRVHDSHDSHDSHARARPAAGGRASTPHSGVRPALRQSRPSLVATARALSPSAAAFGGDAPSPAVPDRLAPPESPHASPRAAPSPPSPGGGREGGGSTAVYPWDLLGSAPCLDEDGAPVSSLAAPLGSEAPRQPSGGGSLSPSAALSTSMPPSAVVSPAPSPPCAVASPEAAAAEVDACVHLLERGLAEAAFRLAFDVMGRDVETGAPIIAHLLDMSDASALDHLPFGLGRDLVHFVCDALPTALDARGVASGGAAEPSSPTRWCDVPLACALAWLEHALQMRRQGGCDLIGRCSGPLCRVLRELSASSNPDLGVRAAKLFALAGSRADRLSRGTPPQSPLRSCTSEAAARAAVAREAQRGMGVLHDLPAPCSQPHRAAVHRPLALVDAWLD